MTVNTSAAQTLLDLQVPQRRAANKLKADGFAILELEIQTFAADRRVRLNIRKLVQQDPLATYTGENDRRNFDPVLEESSNSTKQRPSEIRHPRFEDGMRATAAVTSGHNKK